MKALDAARETLYQQARERRRRPTRPRWPAAGRRAGPARGDGAAPRHRSRRPGRALPGRGPRRRRGAGGPGSAGPVRPRRRRTRSRGNVPAPGVRREPGGDAARRRRPGRGGRRPDPDDSAGDTTSAAPPRPWLSLPGLRSYRSARAITSATGPTVAPPRSRTSRCSVAAITARSTRRAIRSNDGRTASFGSGARTAGLLPEVPPSSGGARRCRAGPAGAERGGGLAPARADATPGWLGEPLDVGYAIDVLHPLAR